MTTRMSGWINSLLPVTLVAGVTLLGISEAHAEAKRKFSYKWSSANTKYTQQHVIDVADAPGHQLRIYEIHRTWTNNAPAFEGVPVKEEWLRAFSDYTDINGQTAGYVAFHLENGDKILGRIGGTSQTIVSSDGSKKSTVAAVITLTGGTGKFRGLRGTARYAATFDPKAGVNEGQAEGDYWIEK